MQSDRLWGAGSGVGSRTAPENDLMYTNFGNIMIEYNTQTALVNQRSCKCDEIRIWKSANIRNKDT